MLKNKMSAGFTLIETLVVVFILSIIATVALPEYSTSNLVRLEIATTEVATALKFARDESIRTGQFHGVHIDRTTTRLYVFKAGTGSNPLVGMTVSYHPLSKQLFDMVLSDNSATKGVSISNTTDPFVYYITSSALTNVLFDEEGTPFWRDGTGAYLLDTATIDLVYGNESKSVVLESGYGRVLVQ